MRIDLAPQLSRPDLHLRPIEHGDVDAWYSYLALPHVVEHTSWNLRSSEELHPLVEWYESSDPASAIRFAIGEAGSPTLIGTIGFHTISLVNRSAEIAYDLHPAYWGRGIATACCDAVVAWGFERLRYVRVQATTLDANRASLRVLEKCAFVREGLLRSYRIVRGAPRDFWMYARVAPHAPAETR